MRAFLLLLSVIATLPTAAQTGARQTQSTTKRAPSPPGFDAKFEVEDYETAFVLIADAIVACVKAQTVQDECLDLLLVGTTTATRAKALEPAETLAAEAARIAEAALPDTDADRLIAARNLAAVLDQAGKPAEALTWHRKALALADRQLPPNAPETGAELKAIAAALDGKDPAGEEAIQRRLLAWRELAEPQNVATSHADLALLLKTQLRYDEADAEYAQAHRRFAAQLGATHNYTLDVLRARIEMLDEAGRRPQMLPLLAAWAALDPPDPLIVRWLGKTRQVLGDYPGAEAAYARAVELQRADPAGDQALLADSIAGIAAALDARGHHAQAETRLREALALLPRTEVQRERELRMTDNLAGAIMSQGRFAEAEGIYRQVVAARRARDPLSLANSLSNLSVALSYLKRLDEAAAVQQEATALRRANLPADHPDIALSESVLAGIEEERNGHAAALALRRTAYERYRRALGDDHPRTAGAAEDLALAIAYTRGDVKEMDTLLTRARQVILRLDPDSYARITNASYLATTLMAGREQLPRVRALLRESVSGIQRRVAGFRDFGPEAQREMRMYSPIFGQQVQAAWLLAAPAKP